MSRLKDTYKNEIVDAMTKKFGYKNIMEVPKLDKIVINMGVGEAKENAKILEAAVKDLETISVPEKSQKWRRSPIQIPVRTSAWKNTGGISSRPGRSYLIFPISTSAANTPKAASPKTTL